MDSSASDVRLTVLRARLRCHCFHTSSGVRQTFELSSHAAVRSRFQLFPYETHNSWRIQVNDSGTDTERAEKRQLIRAKLQARLRHMASLRRGDAEVDSSSVLTRATVTQSADGALRFSFQNRALGATESPSFNYDIIFESGTGCLQLVPLHHYSGRASTSAVSERDDGEGCSASGVACGAGARFTASSGTPRVSESAKRRVCADGIHSLPARRHR